MGTVYLAEDRSNGNERCVVKQLTNKYTDPAEHQEAVRLFTREAQIVRNLRHPGIVRVIDDYATEDGRYFLVMEYVPGKNLDIMVKTGGPFSSDMVIWIAMQCCQVLEYLHEQNPPIIYRDLKPSNLMLTPEASVVFIDFGIARTFMPKEAATRVVSAGYSPPEQYFGKPETRSDIYALGATISHLLTGSRPKPLVSCAPILQNSKVDPMLDELVRRMTAHAIDERPASAMAVRYELAKIYKQMMPDYEIPEDLARKFGSKDTLDRLTVQKRAAVHQAFVPPGVKTVPMKGQPTQVEYGPDGRQLPESQNGNDGQGNLKGPRTVIFDSWRQAIATTCAEVSATLSGKRSLKSYSRKVGLWERIRRWFSLHLS
jgi:serine/threonine protein kinase